LSNRYRLRRRRLLLELNVINLIIVQQNTFLFKLSYFYFYLNNIIAGRSATAKPTSTTEAAAVKDGIKFNRYIKNNNNNKNDLICSQLVALILVRKCLSPCAEMMVRLTPTNVCSNWRAAVLQRPLRRPQVALATVKLFLSLSPPQQAPLQPLLKKGRRLTRR
jgi:hypothetical protein